MSDFPENGMEHDKPTMGSLFSGAGGFELASVMAGIRPVWASEIEPFCVRVTSKRFPEMKHIGDVGRIKGGEIEPVDIITFGSPCFPAETPVITDNGRIPIKDVRPGMFVMTHNMRWKKVLRCGSRMADTIILQDGNGKLECTENHPIYAKDFISGFPKWLEAGKMLNRYWARLHLDKLRWHKVTSISKGREWAPVFNIEVDEDNSYIAGDIAVHNCQDLSVAGKRAGIQEGERSSLFFEAIRIIREMREATGGRKPEFIVFENVGGIFSSNSGEDFRTVLREIAKTADGGADVPKPEKWMDAGEIVGKGYSVAWRVLDAQYWGVPQRRTRLFLVADFRGTRASRILFEQDRLLGDIAEGRGEGEGTAGDAEGDTGNTSWACGFCWNAGITARGIGYSESTFPTLRASKNCAGAATNICLNDQGGSVMDVSEGVANTLRSEAHGHGPVVLSPVALDYGHPCDGVRTSDIMPSLEASDHKGKKGVFTTVGVIGALQAGDCKHIGNQYVNAGKVILEKQESKVFGLSSKDSNSWKSDNPRSGIYEAETTRTVDTSGNNPTCNQGGMIVAEYSPKVFESHIKDARYREMGDKGETVVARYGTGGGNAPIVCEAYAIGNEQAHNSGISEVCPALNTMHDAMAAIVPKDGEQAYMAFTQNQRDEVRDLGDKSGALTVAGTKNQTYVLQGSMIGRKDENGPQGNGISEGVCFTLNTVDRHVVAWPYVARRLMPIECARLQGFPDWWTDGLESKEPDEEEVRRWMQVFEIQREALLLGTKPRTANQVRKWLQNPYSDSALYKMWGNSVAIPCVYHVMAGVAEAFGWGPDEELEGLERQMSIWDILGEG